MPNPHYPGADRTTQYFVRAYLGSLQIPRIVVLHTTEGPGWPGYVGGATAPNFTVRPDVARRAIEVRQHYPVNRSSRALENRIGGVETNTHGCVQIELIGTCDPTHRYTWAGIGRAGVHYVYWPDAPDWLLAELANVLRWLNTEWGIPLRNAAPRGWLPYPSSYGNANGHRLTFAEWYNAAGVLGHQDVPENHHGDPGDLNATRLLQLANNPTTVPEEDDMTIHTTEFNRWSRTTIKPGGWTLLPIDDAGKRGLLKPGRGDLSYDLALGLTASAPLEARAVYVEGNKAVRARRTWSLGAGPSTLDEPGLLPNRQILCVQVRPTGDRPVTVTDTRATVRYYR